MKAVPLIDSPELPILAKSILDLDALVSLMQKGHAGTKPWQRLLSLRLADLAVRIQVLRLTVNMNRGEGEILDAASSTLEGCRQAILCIAGSRADPYTKASLNLVNNLAEKIHTSLASICASMSSST